MKVYFWDQGYCKSFHECNPHKEIFTHIFYFDHLKTPFTLDEFKSISKLIEGNLPDKCEVWELELPD